MSFYHFICRHWLIRDLVVLVCCTWMVFRRPRAAAQTWPHMVFGPPLPACIFCSATAPTTGIMCCSNSVRFGCWIRQTGDWQWIPRLYPTAHREQDAP